MILLFYRIIRLTALILVLATFFTLLSGFLLVKFNLIPWLEYGSYKFVHTVIMPLIFVPVFYLHSFSGIMILINGTRLARKHLWMIAAGTLWSIVFVGFGFLYIVKNPLPTADPNASSAVNTITNDVKSGLVLSAEEISGHDNAQSCWLIISGRVYDLTGFLNQHPGQASAILPNCGKDGTIAYATKGERGQDHSDYAKNLLSSYYIGDFNQKKIDTSAEAGTSTQKMDGTKILPPSLSSVRGSVVPILPKKFNLTKSEVGKHNNARSCWLIISDRVYDVTGFLNQHPGQASAILPNCGKDSTGAYATKGGSGNDHSSYAKSLLATYYIGSIGQTIPVSAVGNIQTTQKPAVNNPAQPVMPTENKNNIVVNGKNINLSLIEISKHNNAQSCWMVISGKVYDLTGFLNRHPGQASAILPNCGKDGTNAYATKGGKGSDHSSYAKNLLVSYYIGDVNQQVAETVVNQVNLANPAVVNSENEVENEIENKTRIENVDLLHQKFPGATIIEMEVDDRGGYEAKIIINGARHEVRVDAAGNILRDTIEN